MTYELSHGEALLMGAIEGLTEFLPVSSTGHLIITGDLIGFTGEAAKTFEIAIQLGAILAICWHYRARLLGILYGLPSDPAARRFALNLLVAFLPAALLGALFHGAIKALLFRPVTVAIALVVGGLLILLVERTRGEPRVRSIDDLSWRDALVVGCAQALALVPGTSRSGATIVGGLAFGLSRQVATEFSFFLAIPTMFAATIFDLGANFGQLGRHDLEVLGLGFASAMSRTTASAPSPITGSSSGRSYSCIFSGGPDVVIGMPDGHTSVMRNINMIGQALFATLLAMLERKVSARPCAGNRSSYNDGASKNG